MSINRIFLIVLDSVGIGEMPDSENYGDKGSNTLKSCYMQKNFSIPTMKKMGIFNIDGVDYDNGVQSPVASYGKFAEASKGKDTTTGHWEICGIISENPLPTYPDGFPEEIINEFSKRTGRNVLCNKPYSGTQVLTDYGAEHIKSGDLIVYTSADSVFQIAAHEEIVPTEKLYEYCEIAREILKGKHGVGRVIARPFEGIFPNFKRTSGRHDFSLVPPKTTLIDLLKENGITVIPVGKIYDIFAGKSMKKAYPTKSNSHGMELTEHFAKQNFKGLCFVNLVDFDMMFGHRNNCEGYAQALTEFDSWLSGFIKTMKDDDVLMITADHGCDPATPSTDHSREHVPLLVYGEKIKNVNLGTRKTFADIGKTIADIFNADGDISGKSFKDEIIRE